jgi:quinol monooxygenase YgiN
MPQLALIGRIEVAPGSLEKMLPLLAAHRDRCLRDEPGTLKFEVLRPRDEENVILVYELYQDDAAFDVHRNGPSMARFRKEAGEMMARLTATRCTPVEREVQVNCPERMPFYDSGARTCSHFQGPKASGGRYEQH